MSRCKCLLSLLLVLVAAGPALALELASPFGDHMVLQRGMAVPVWGTAEAGEKITVAFADQSVSTTAKDDGTWRVSLEQLTANATPRELTVTGSQSDQPLVLQDVLVGEVWLCGGQSNMQWTVSRSANPEIEAANADHPLIRLGQVKRSRAAEPQDTVNMSWAVCSPETASNFSAVGYYFGRELHQQFQQKADGKQNGGVIPIGLISSNWGGTKAEVWTPLDRFKGVPEIEKLLTDYESYKAAYPDKVEQHKQQLAEWEKKPEEDRGRKPRGPRPIDHQGFPATLYNAMIHPVAPYAIRGTIWYQGESNAGRAEQYKTLLPVMIDAWRDAFERPKMPFGIVQLANFRQPLDEPGKDDNWAALRWAQYLTAKNDPNAGLAVAIDIGEAKDIHPKNKQDVGKRLAAWALGDVYERVYPAEMKVEKTAEGKIQVTAEHGIRFVIEPDAAAEQGQTLPEIMRSLAVSGPVYRSMEVCCGNVVRLKFDHAWGGLVVTPGEAAGRFQLQDVTGKWYWADASVEDDTVVLRAEGSGLPVAVRYAWEMNPPATIYNRLGLPMVPFTTESPW